MPAIATIHRFIVPCTLCLRFARPCPPPPPSDSTDVHLATHTHRVNNIIDLNMDNLCKIRSYMGVTCLLINVIIFGS